MPRGAIKSELNHMVRADFAAFSVVSSVVFLGRPSGLPHFFDGVCELAHIYPGESGASCSSPEGGSRF
jgi:hypothetical protein